MVSLFPLKYDMLKTSPSRSRWIQSGLSTVQSNPISSYAHFAAGLQESSADEPQPDIEIPA
jgi:hypothetical protein